jgi:hypothetical protein
MAAPPPWKTSPDSSRAPAGQPRDGAAGAGGDRPQIHARQPWEEFATGLEAESAGIEGGAAGRRRREGTAAGAGRDRRQQRGGTGGSSEEGPAATVGERRRRRGSVGGGGRSRCGLDPIDAWSRVIFRMGKKQFRLVEWQWLVN